MVPPSRYVLAVGVLLGGALAASSCGSLITDPAELCTADVECPAGFACTEGFCQPSPPPPLPPPAECADNQGCGAEEVCSAGACVRVGQCLTAVHCGCLGSECVGNVCQGPSPCEVGPAMPCAITAECPAHFYCIGGACLFATECLEHADCPTGSGCFVELCWPL